MTLRLHRPLPSPHRRDPHRLRERVRHPHRRPRARRRFRHRAHRHQPHRLRLPIRHPPRRQTLHLHPTHRARHKACNCSMKISATRPASRFQTTISRVWTMSATTKRRPVVSYTLPCAARTPTLYFPWSTSLHRAHLLPFRQTTASHSSKFQGSMAGEVSYPPVLWRAWTSIRQSVWPWTESGPG